MKKNKFLVVVFFLFNLNVFGQGRIELLKPNHDFGTIMESDGPVLHQFEFINIGDQPLVVKNIKASCGCTTPAWSKDSISSGEKGFFQAKYNPQNRPGLFSKTLTVTTNGDPAVLKAYISGTVEPREETIQEKMSVKIGATRLKSRVINLGRATNEGVVVSDFDIFNDSMDTLSLLRKYDAPNFITLNFEDSVLIPGSKINVSLTYNTDHADNLGMKNYAIKLYTDETVYSEKKLDVMLTLREYFPKMTEEELAKSPKLKIEERLKNIGEVVQGESETIEFIITNDGREKLEIRKLQSNCSCLVSNVTDRSIKAGDSAKVIVVFNGGNRIGRQNKSVSIYSNDPINSTQIMTIRASVVKKK